jgi:hypothetical protein
MLSFLSGMFCGAFLMLIIMSILFAGKRADEQGHLDSLQKIDGQG